MRTRTKTAVMIVLALVMGMMFGVAMAGSEETTYNFDEKYLHKMEHDNGFSNRQTIDKDDPHYGWSLGTFKLTGWSGQDEIDGQLVFYKNVNDDVKLSFNLEQDIKKLNGDKDLYISEDTNGYDKYFQIKETNFGHGALIIRYTDPQNEVHEPQLFTDYLSASEEEGADTKVHVLEEGDYEVCLDYEIGEKGLILDSYYDYEIFFSFSVRNGNSMVFLIDLDTENELFDRAFTENGFKVDFAKSSSVDVIVKKEKLIEGSSGLVEDVRFNRPAKDGEKFTEEGLYTIKATNKYTNETTIKKLYVGTNEKLKACAVTGYSIDEINNMKKQGYSIASDGTLVPPLETDTAEANSLSSMLVYVAMIAVAGIIVVMMLVLLIKRRHKTRAEQG